MLSLAEVAKEVFLRVDQEPEAGVPPLTKSGVFELTKAVFDVCGKALASGEEISIPKFGKIVVTVRGARKGRNPHSGKPLDIPARASVKFKPSSVLKEEVGKLDVSVVEEMAKKKVKPKKKKDKKGKKGKKK